MMQKKRSILVFGFFLAVFFFFFLFFFHLHPITVSDADDWTYLTFHRDAIPIWRARNPIRIFAEITIPAVSSISSALFFPVTGNIFTALSLGYALCLTGAITLLSYVLYLVLCKQHSAVASLFITFFFLICHFWIIRTGHQDNDYMLRTADACTVFYYVIPNLLNCALVLWLERKPELIKWSGGLSNREKAVFIVFSYFCIFSNIWSGMILATYCGSKLLFSLPILLKEKKQNSWLSNHIVLFAIIALWLVSQFFEMNGIRAIRMEKSITDEIQNTLSALFQTAGKVNRRYLTAMALLFFGGLIVQLKERNRSALKTCFLWTVCLVLSCLYLILTCSKASSSYIKRPDVFYGLFFFGFMAVAVNGTALIRRVPFSKAFLLLLLVIILNDCTSGGRTFRESNVLNLSPRIINNVNNDIVKQLKDAEREGLDTMVLEVPQFDSKNNWPYSLTANNAIAEGMWKLGVLERNIQIDRIMPLEEKNTLLLTGSGSSCD